jgi:hypothetical protein
VRLLPHLQRFCEIDVQGPVYQDSLFSLPMLENCSDPEKAKNAFDNAKRLFLESGPPRKASAKEWVKKVLVPLIESGFGDPFDLPIVPSLSEKKLFGLGNDKTDRSPNERISLCSKGSERNASRLVGSDRSSSDRIHLRKFQAGGAKMSFGLSSTSRPIFRTNVPAIMHRRNSPLYPSCGGSLS